ncbi:FimV/HubP family polar landmark protein [Marinobacter sp. SS21]|uniref:FimV/HubP family polar landmark protein n=1 Tax=Marinobacter sp. SS21 TaxID=2979460 RepID=UPI00232F01E9|nr:FimV/HubP family polar landmark protein [Marinobacter sp. SS21]MDC0661874.1 hypothetical protein [Marinobacter sp. SS21]
MKVRKLAVALALAGGLGSGVAQALGLGEIELQSFLNEPLEADISLSSSAGINSSEVFVNLAPAEAYRQVGIVRSYFLTKLQFNVTTAPNGSLVVNVSSAEPVKEPYLNFLLEVTWPSGRLMREYAVLVDPPVYAEESGLVEQVQVPQAPAQSRPAPAQQPSVSSTPAAPVTSPSPVATRPAADTYGPTGPSDTLWAIASAVRPDASVSHQQVMLAIQDLNPDAFINGNINRMKRGQILRVPSPEQIQSRTRAEATRQVTAQNEALTATPQRPVDARAAEAAQLASDSTPAAGGDELKLLVADQPGARTAEEGGSAGGDGQLAGGVDAGSAVAMEELESTRRENEELSGRVEDLQSQVETLRRLLELKNSQLAEFEQGLAAQDGVESAPPGVEIQAPGDVVDGDAALDVTEEGAGPDRVEVQPGDEGQPADAEDAADELAAEAEPAAMGEAAPADAMAPEVESDESSITDTGLPSMADEAIVPPQADSQDSEKGFPGNIIDMIVRNPMYQIGLGGGLVLLLLLLLRVARRNANKEREFYAQLESEGDQDEAGAEPVPLTTAAGEAEDEVADPLAEADTYIAYGRLDQAVQSLEGAISREPSRSDLRVKLLGVYADAQNRAAFDKQYGELEALDDDSALAEATALRARLAEAEETPSIDELESELLSDSFRDEVKDLQPPGDQAEAVSAQESVDETEATFADFDLGDEEPAPVADAASADEEAIEFDLSDLELEDTEAAAAEPATEVKDIDEALMSASAEPESEDRGLEFELDEDVAEAASELELELGDLDDDSVSIDDLESVELQDQAPELEDDFTSIELADELGGELPQAEAGEPEELLQELEPEADEGLDALDESFLDELDAELDKVAGEMGEEPADEGLEGLEGLELDVSDEDLALIEEAADFAQGEPESDVAAGEMDLDVEDLSMDDLLEETTLSEEAPVLDEVPELGPEAPVAEESVPEAGEQTEAPAKSGFQDIDEAELGEEDDFDFLAGTDEAATKLDLARAYIEMGDADGARDILEEVAIEGDDKQKVEAQDLLKTLS